MPDYYWLEHILFLKYQALAVFTKIGNIKSGPLDFKLWDTVTKIMILDGSHAALNLNNRCILNLFTLLNDGRAT